MFSFDVLVFDMFLLAVLVRAVSGVVFGMLLSHVCGKFRAVGGTASFDFLGFFLGELRNFCNDGFLDLFGMLFVFFVKFSAADYGIGLRLFLRFLVLGLDETGGERGDLIFVQFTVIPDGFHMVDSRLLWRLREARGSSLLNGVCSFS